MKLFFRFLITVLLLILLYTIYRSEISWGGGKRHYYLIQCIGILLAIFFLIICTYLNEKIQKYIIIIFISTIFAFYTFEVKLIFEQKKNSSNLDKKKNNLNFDRRTVIEVYNDLKKNNLNVTVTAPPILQLNELDFLSLAGISNAKTIFCNENGYYSIYQSDRYGFNNPDEEWDSKKIEYLLVGDSFTHGACVDRPNDIGSALRRHSKKNVLNLGYTGNGPLLEYATLREYLEPKVKNVLWLYFEGNDLSNLENELKNNILNKYLVNQKFKQDLKIKQTQIDQILTNFLEKEKERKTVKEKDKQTNFHSATIIKFIKLSNIRSLLITPPYSPPSLPPPPELNIILKLAKELVENYNGKLYFVYLPEINRYNKSNSLKKNNNKLQIKKIVNNLGIEFVDIDEEVFQKEKNPLKLFPFEQYGHYNVEGYKKVALKIYEKTK
jgi:hypothetical protein